MHIRLARNADVPGQQPRSSASLRLRETKKIDITAPGVADATRISRQAAPMDAQQPRALHKPKRSSPDFHVMAVTILGSSLCMKTTLPTSGSISSITMG
ncbi:hypothetical protein LTR85_000067 [Meristemomyces frigidus]|nr:hypothetical protein LTR85_000067 [Meristemomyces frigidus]